MRIAGRAQRRAWIAAMLLIALPAHARPAHAQVLRGTVRGGLPAAEPVASTRTASTRAASALNPSASTPSDNPPVAGVLVELRDATGTVLSRRLTNPRGEFVFTLPAQGQYQLEARRIGFRRASVLLGNVARDTAVSLTLAPVPITLPAVSARELNRCRNQAERGSATSTLWESAVTSLLSASAAIADTTLIFDVMPSVRSYTLPDGYLVDVTLRDERVRDARPWSSLDPADLAEFGYVRLVGRALQYVAPDVDVLTSREFLRTHCLQVREDRMADGLIGLAFAPTDALKQADIRGVLWIDRDSQELRNIDYTYASLPLATAVADSFAGGRVELAPLSSGGWIPSRWSVRSPVPEAAFVNAVAYRGEDLQRAGLPVAVRALDPPLRSARLQVTGSAVQRVRRVRDRDTIDVWTRQPTAVEVTVEWTQNGVSMPASQARVSLSGSTRAGTADLLGRVTFAELPDGDYFVEAITDIERALRLPAERQAVVVTTGGTARVRLPVVAPAAAVEAVCGADVRGGVLAGVITQHGRPVPDAHVSLLRFASDDYALYADQVLGAGETDSLGRYVMCGVPRGVPLTLAAVTDRGALGVIDGALPSSREAPGVFVTLRDISLRPPVMSKRRPVVTRERRAEGTRDERHE